eukprot:753776-Hanusia_phi.AAC.14
MMKAKTTSMRSLMHQTVAMKKIQKQEVHDAKSVDMTDSIEHREHFGTRGKAYHDVGIVLMDSKDGSGPVVVRVLPGQVCPDLPLSVAHAP